MFAASASSLDPLVGEQRRPHFFHGLCAPVGIHPEHQLRQCRCEQLRIDICERQGDNL